MKKLLFTIIIPITMVCCKSENTEQELIETQQKEVNCLFARISAEGELTGVNNHWRNSEKIDGYSRKLPSGVSHEFHCFDVSKYTTKEMIEIIKNKY